MPQTEAMSWTTSWWSSSRTVRWTTCSATFTAPKTARPLEGVIGNNLSNPIPERAEHGAEHEVVPYTVATDMEAGQL